VEAPGTVELVGRVPAVIAAASGDWLGDRDGTLAWYSGLDQIPSCCRERCTSTRTHNFEDGLSMLRVRVILETGVSKRKERKKREAELTRLGTPIPLQHLAYVLNLPNNVNEFAVVRRLRSSLKFPTCETTHRGLIMPAYSDHITPARRPTKRSTPNMAAGMAQIERESTYFPSTR
jgi:hypothetical protein